MSQVKAGSVFVACCSNTLEQYITAPAFVYPAGAVSLKNSVTFCAVLPVLAATLVIKAPPLVKLIPVIAAIDCGLVITPACETEPPPPARFAIVQSNAVDKPFTVTAID